MTTTKAKTSNLILILSIILITLSGTSCKKSLPPIGDIELGISKEEALKQLEKAGSFGLEPENYPKWIKSWNNNILGVKWDKNEYKFNDKDELIGVYCWSSNYMSQSDIKVLHAKMEELCGNGTITTDDGEEFNVRYGIYDDK